MAKIKLENIKLRTLKIENGTYRAELEISKKTMLIKYGVLHLTLSQKIVL